MQPAWLTPMIAPEDSSAPSAITTDQVPGKRSPGSLSWGGINNTYFWIDPSRGIAGVILMQYLPFADAKALAVYDAFERGAYQLMSAER
jgi:methyl acetate hydrolase